MDTFEWSFLAVKLTVLVAMLMSVAPIMNWVERRGAALIQLRLGPNRVGPFGILQALPDAVKFLFKEDSIPEHVQGFYYFIAPILCLIPALMTFAAIPFADPMNWQGHALNFYFADLNVGILYVLAIASLGVYGIIIAGWSSNNKYSLLGSLRSSSQMISYELSMGLSIIGIVMIFSSVHLGDIAQGQALPFFHLGPLVIPKWGIFVQPVGFLIFFTCAHAETNRLPFDLPEGESELIAGYHLEYGSMKFALFMMAEYINMVTASGLMATLYFGGYQMLPGMKIVLDALALTGATADFARVGMQGLSLLLKTAFFMWVFVWTRWTLPRFRYDQLMDLGWRVMFPASLLNVFVTGILIYYGWV